MFNTDQLLNHQHLSEGENEHQQSIVTTSLSEYRASQNQHFYGPFNNKGGPRTLDIPNLEQHRGFLGGSGRFI